MRTFSLGRVAEKSRGMRKMADMEAIRVNVKLACGMAEDMGMIAAKGTSIPPFTVETTVNTIRDLLNAVLVECDVKEQSEPPSG